MIKYSDFIQIVPNVLLKSFFWSKMQSRITYCLYLVSFNLEHSKLLVNSSQLFCRISLNLGLYYILHDLTIKFRLFIFSKNKTNHVSSMHRIRRSWFVPFTGDVNLDHWLRWYLPDFSTVKLLLFPSVIYSYAMVPHMILWDCVNILIVLCYHTFFH